ncbi:unnamed protein product [Brassica rapa]|uniref:Uncharacterized protein n=2 Tax=Brassica TaxID=3705 RepID=A0A8D9GZP0_BRACM|nr:unnamed protein product [Brassica napus]CAG7889925.1 unnamed protein product [Brassica rapa]
MLSFAVFPRLMNSVAPTLASSSSPLFLEKQRKPSYDKYLKICV